MSENLNTGETKLDKIFTITSYDGTIHFTSVHTSLHQLIDELISLSENGIFNKLFSEYVEEIDVDHFQKWFKENEWATGNLFKFSDPIDEFESDAFINIMFHEWSDILNTFVTVQ